MPDSNPATDGEILIAQALFQAADRWNRPAYAEVGGAIARDIMRLLVKQSRGRSVLMPGLYGFETRAQLVVNPSYYLFPALQTFARQTGDTRWQTLHDDGLGLLREARFGRWGLAPDWLGVPRDAGPLTMAPNRPARFSYDAVRLPLYMAWAGLHDEPAVRAALAFWADTTNAAAWADLRNNDVAPYAMASGMVAIRNFVRARSSGTAALASLRARGTQLLRCGADLAGARGRGVRAGAGGDQPAVAPRVQPWFEAVPRGTVSKAAPAYAPPWAGAASLMT